MNIVRTLVLPRPPEEVFAYLQDFTNTEEWDPGTQTCERVAGDGGVGTTYRNVTRFLGREVEVMYTTAELAPPRRVHLRGTNGQFEGHDIFEIAASGRGARVSYTAEMSFSGLARLATPVVAAYLPTLASRTVDQLRTCLDRLDDPGPLSA